MSSSGKSTLLEQIKRTILENNDIALLSFEFEMLIEDQLERTESSGYDINQLEDKNYYYVDRFCTVEQMTTLIREFVYSNIDKQIIVTIDHTLLVKGKGEKETIDNLMTGLVELKKEFNSLQLNVSFICLSQLNREIESDNRILNPLLHYPTKKDLFGSDVVFQCSDHVYVIHRPAIIAGINAIGYYGKQKLPLKHEGRDVVYGHIIKNRFGETGMLTYLEDLKHGKLDAINLQKRKEAA